MVDNHLKAVIVNLIMMTIFWLALSPVGVTQSAQNGNKDKLIIANEIRLVDEDGVVRAGLQVENNSTPVLYFTDKNMKVKGYIGVSDGRAMLVFKDDSGKPRLTLHMSKKRTPSIILENKNDKPALVLSTTDEENSLIHFFQSDGKPRMAIGISNDQPRIGMFDEDKRLRVMFGMNPGNSSVLAFLDEKSYPALAMGHLLGTPMFRLQRPDKTGVFASYAPDNNVILSMQKEGRFTWSVPEIPRGGRAGDDPLNGIDWDNMIKGWSK